MYLVSVIVSPRRVRMSLSGRQEVRDDFIDEELSLLPLTKQVGISLFNR